MKHFPPNQSALKGYSTWEGLAPIELKLIEARNS